MEGPGLGSQVSAARRGGDGGGAPSGGQVRQLRDGARAWALAIQREMLLVAAKRGLGGRACRFHLAAGRHAPASGSAGTWRVSGDTPQVAQPALDLGLPGVWEISVVFSPSA